MKAVVLVTSTGAVQEWTPDFIRETMAKSDKAVITGMLKVYQFQTNIEKAHETTRVVNFVGFNGVDAELLTSFCKQYQVKGYLTDKQIALARKKMLKYSKQLFNCLCADHGEKIKDIPKPKKDKATVVQELF